MTQTQNKFQNKLDFRFLSQNMSENHLQSIYEHLTAQYILYKKNFLACLFILMSVLNISGQELDPPSTNKIEGIDFLLTTGHSLQSTRPDSSLFLGFQAKELSQKVDYNKGIANANLLIGTSYLLSENLDSATYYIKESIRQTEYYNIEEVQCRAYSNYGIVLLYKGSLDSAEIYFHRALVIYNKIKNYQGAYKALNNLATVAIFNDDYSLSLEYLFECLELSEHLEDPTLLPRTYSNISSSYQNIGDYEQALDYLKKSMSYGVDEADYKLKIVNANKLGDIYLNLGDTESARETFVSILNLYRGKQDCWLLESHLGISDTYIEMGDLDSALSHAKIAYDMSQDCGFFHFNYQTLFQQGIVYLEMGNYDQAEYHFKECEATFETMQIDEGFYELFAYLSQVYELKGDYKSSLSYYKHYKALQDSSLNEKNLRALSRVEMNKEFAAEKQILMAKQEAQERILQEKVAYETQTRNYILAGLVILIIALAVGTRSYMQVRMANKTLAKNNKIIKNQSQELSYKAELLKQSNEEVKKLSSYREGLAHMAVHDMKNPLNTIMGLSEEGEVTKEQLRKINKASRHIFTFLTNILDIYKFEETNIAIDVKPHRVMDQINEAVHDVEILVEEKGITILKELSMDLVGTYDSQLVRRILTNLITNSIKYSKYGQDILIKGYATEEEIVLSVVDFGQGIKSGHIPHLFEKFTPTKPQRITGSASTGIGLNFCQLAVEAHGGKIWAESEVGKGTKFSFTFPLREIPDYYLDENGIEAIAEEINQKLILPDEVDVILESTNELKGYQVYQIGKINKVIAHLEKIEVQSPWKNKLKAIAYRGDQQDYADFLTETLNQYGQ